MKVRDVLRLLRSEGWFEVSMRGSHRQFKHRTRLGRVTVSGKPNDDLAVGTRNSILKQAGLRNRQISMRYAIVIEKAEGNFSSYVPDLPGCIATGATLEETERAIRDAIAFHLEGLRDDGLPIPQPTCLVDYVEVAA
jgi:predicted RNase H-like HicB family nuclease/predicted RNA binding protein YcfA (HicA-like mRNA interferase family)